MPLLRNPDRSKLSKRQGHVSVEWYRENGYIPEALKNFFALMGWAHPEQIEVFPESEFIKHFDLADVSVRAPIFDLEKLTWMNGVYIRKMPDDEVYDRLLEYSKIYDQDTYQLLQNDKDYVMQVLPLVKDRMETLKLFAETTGYFFTDDYEIPSERINSLIKDQGSRETFITQCIEVLENLEYWTVESIEQSMRAVQQELELKPKHAFMTLRFGVTGQKATPPMFDTMFVLGKEKVIMRLNRTRELITNAD